MTNLEKLGYSKEAPTDELAVDMLLNSIKNDVEGKCFDNSFPTYERLYKSMKELLESEVEE